MSDYIISCCSTADLSKEHFERRNISYISFHFFMDEKEYLDDLGQSLPFEEFYKAMENGVVTRTSQINAYEFKDYFEKYLKEGKDIIHLCLSSGISGVYNSACMAKDMLEKTYTGRKIYIVDTLGASSGYGLLTDIAADLRDSGLSIDELYEKIESIKLKVNHWFFSTDLKYYVRGGRISKVSGWVGTILKICPLLNMDKAGKLIPREKIRTKAKAIDRIVLKMTEYADNGTDYDGKCYICHSSCIEDAEAVKNKIESKFKNLKNKVEIYSIGTTIGSHTGPGTVALFFCGKERNE